jgi:magnesium chelatase family protein
VPAVKPADLSLPPPAESSADVAARVTKARAVQTQRFATLPEGRRPRTNAELEGAATVARIHIAEALSYRRLQIAR